MFFDLDMIEIFMLISLAITFILFFCIMHHFKHRILSLETKTDTMYKIINELVKLQKMHIQDTRPSQPELGAVIKPQNQPIAEEEEEYNDDEDEDEEDDVGQEEINDSSDESVSEGEETDVEDDES